MKIDDKDIDKLLENFSGEDIDIPKNLDGKLNEKLSQIKPKKNHKLLKIASISIIILIGTYTLIPSFRSFANDVFKYIFGDIGIENAVNNDYKNSNDQILKIGNYEIEVENIYVDDLRISFDAIIKENKTSDKKEEDEVSYSLFVDTNTLEKDYNTDDISITNKFEKTDEGDNKINVQIIGEGISKILFKDRNNIKLKLELSKNSIGVENEVIGSEYINIENPNIVNKSKVIQINKLIEKDNLKLSIDKLDISPTMMFLYSSGEIKDIGDIQGLYDFKIVSSNNKVYKENLSLSGKGDKNEYKQTIVPSIYYDKSNSFRLIADGVLVRPKYKDIKISLEDSYPKKIEYFGSTMYIEDVKYEDGKLKVYIRDNDSVYGQSVCLLDGNNDIGGGMSEYEGKYRIHNFDFEVEKKDSYVFSLQMIMKQKLPIDIKVDI